MFTKQEFRGRWNQIKGKMKDRWGQLTEEDLASVEGNLDNLVWVVRNKVGSGKQEVEAYVDQCFNRRNPSAVNSQMSDKSRTSLESREQLPGLMPSASTTAAQPAHDSFYATATELAASIFASGFLAGVIFGLLWRAF